MMFKEQILALVVFFLFAGPIFGNSSLGLGESDRCCPENNSIRPAKGSERIAPLQSIPTKEPISVRPLSAPDAVIVPGPAGAALPNVADMIVGRVAGVLVMGGGFNNYFVRIRGAMGPPLIVIDEMPFYHANDDAAFNAVLQSVPTAEVASLEILKSVAQTALYGGQGANGVIRINTKGYAQGWE